MTIHLCKQVGLFTFLATFAASTANAQYSNCMRMGDQMVHCNGSDGSSTDCMAMGDNMASCNSVGGVRYQGTYAPRSAPQSNQPSGGLIDDLFGVRIQESAFRKKIGKMMAAGDCRGAAQYAYEKGRIELGSQIAQTCRPANAGER